MQEKSYSKKLYSEKNLENESISLLEWDSLKTHLASFASTEMGKRAISSFEIPSEYEISKRLLNETVEITELENTLDKSISFSGVFDISRNIEICSKGGVILSSDLLEIAKTIAAARNLKKISLDFELRPFISSFTKNLIDHQNIETIFKKGVESNGRISDNASNELSILRKELLSKKLERKILGVLEGDCNTAAGIYANVRGKNVNVIAELFSDDGNKKFTYKDECKIEEALKIAEKAGNDLKKQFEMAK